MAGRGGERAGEAPFLGQSPSLSDVATPKSLIPGRRRQKFYQNTDIHIPHYNSVTTNNSTSVQNAIIYLRTVLRN
jgi:precorrin-3B methylase